MNRMIHMIQRGQDSLFYLPRPIAVARPIATEDDRPRPRPNWGVLRMGSRARIAAARLRGGQFLPSSGVKCPELLPPSSGRARQS